MISSSAYHHIYIIDRSYSQFEAAFSPHYMPNPEPASHARLTRSPSTTKSLVALITGSRQKESHLDKRDKLDKLENRRAINRRSQKKTRQDKESLIKRLLEENQTLKESLETR